MALLTKRASTWLLDHKAEVLQDCFHERLTLLYKLHFMLVHESHANSTNAPIPDRPRNGSVWAVSFGRPRVPSNAASPPWLPPLWWLFYRLFLIWATGGESQEECAIKEQKHLFFFVFFFFFQKQSCFGVFFCRWNLEMLASVSFAFILPGAQSVLLYQFVL